MQGMKNTIRPVLPAWLRAILIGTGVFCGGVGILLLILFRTHWALAEGTVEEKVQSETNSTMVRGVSFMRGDGTKGAVPFAEKTLPAHARAGDRVTVAYIPGSTNALVCTFNSVWKVPAVALGIGAAFTLLGLVLRSPAKAA
jgi:hypothetical protein